MGKKTENKNVGFIKRHLILIGKFFDKIADDNVAAFSAQAAFFMILSLFPFCMLLMTIIQYTPLTKNTLLSLCDIYLPNAFDSYARALLDEIYSKTSGTFISVSIISSLWLGSKGFTSMFAGLNSVYDVKEKNNYFKVRFFSMFYTVIFAVAIIGSLTVLVFGNKLSYWLTENVPEIGFHVASIINVRVTISGLLLLLLFMTMYKIMPNRKATLYGQFPGALFAAAGWIGFSYIYSFYIDNISNYVSIYGTMTTIIFLMIWLYACMYIIFLGGAINHVIQTTIFFRELRARLWGEKKA